MAKYVIVETCYEYDDEYYNKVDGYNITSKLYSEEQLAEAKAEVDRLNEKTASDEYFRNWNNEQIKPFTIVKIEE
jgi:hypothetical protein